MGDVIHEGYGQAVPQVDTITVADTWAAADTVVITINAKVLTLTVGTDTDTGEVALAIQEMMSGTTQTGTGDHTYSANGTTIGEFAKLTATVLASVVTVTGPADGQTFTMSVVATTAGDGDAVEATATTGTGPNFWSLATNWSTGAVPVGADDVFIQGSAVPLKYALDANAVTLTSLTVRADVTGAFYIGLPDINLDSSTYPHDEYLEDQLKISATTVNIGTGTGGGIKGFRFNTGTNATTLNLYKTGTSLYANQPPLQWVGVHATNALNINRGSIGIACRGGEAATFLTLRVGYITTLTSDATVYIGSGATHQAGGTIEQIGGDVTSNAAIITLNQDAGTFTLGGTATATTVNIGGTFYDQSSGTITTVKVFPGGVFDKRQDARAQTITNCSIYKGAKFYDPAGTITFTNPPQFIGCGVEDFDAGDIQLGKNISLAITAL